MSADIFSWNLTRQPGVLALLRKTDAAWATSLPSVLVMG